MYKSDSSLLKADDSEILWRYMNFSSFYSLATNKTLFFRRLDRYTDQFEGTLHEQTKEQLLKYRMRFVDTEKEKVKADDWTKKELMNIESYKAQILSNSWNLGSHENYALWKIYCKGGNEGVAIKTTVKDLIDSFSRVDVDVYSGKVTYDPVQFKQIDVFTVATNKRPEYRYENEYRALIPHQFKLLRDDKGKIIKDVDQKQIKEPLYQDGKSVPIDLEKLIQEIYVSPFASNWFEGIVKSVSKDYLGFLNSDKIIRSKIKDN